MHYILSAQSTLAAARNELGGKGFNLYLMSRAELPVPPWVAVPSRAFKQFRQSQQLDATIAAILAQELPLKNFAAAAKAIHACILAAPLSAELIELVDVAWARVGGGPVAVRSSAADEDSGAHSFAGQLTTILGVSGRARLQAAVKECWASAYSERGLSYRAQHGLAYTAEVAVVIQAMLDCSVSGVLFTVDPVTQSADTMTVSAVYGLGEGLVSGLLDADTFSLHKADGSIKSQHLALKDKQLSRRGDGELIEESVPSGMQESACLSPNELVELADLGRRVEAYYQRPQDLEWGYVSGKLWLLQTRPITALTQNLSGELQIWDNSNIIESYGGLTLPLTFTFARYVYREVYVQLCEILLVPAEQINVMEYNLRNMLGLFSGRVYYNLLNWYRLLTIIPGFKQNRSFMETMMGVREELAEEAAARCQPPVLRHPLRAKARRFLSGIRLFGYHWRAQPIVDAFLRDFRQVYAEFRQRDYERLPAEQIYAYYRSLEERLLKRWHAPIINDMLCMIHFGVLKKLCTSWLSALGTSIQNDLLCGDGNLESAEPTRELMRMAATAAKDETLRRFLLETPARDAHELLMTSEFVEFKGLVASYIDRFGFRCMNEMKLEQADLHDDPSFLYVCLRNYLVSGRYDLSAYQENEQRIRAEAEAKVAQTLHGLRYAVFKWFLHHARKAVRNRENTRFCRTRLYGVIRRMFYAWGRDYVGRNLIDHDRDIFFLTLDELHGSIDATLTVQDLRVLIAMRKEAYKGFAADDPAPRFITRGPPYWQNAHAPVAEPVLLDDTPLAANQLRGLPCCPGEIEGIVKVILSPDDDMTLNGEILVAPRTDPGWVPLYPACSGLLVERGSLLSHSAIVAREMGLPAIVGIQGLQKRLKSGMRVRMNGATGMIEILDSAGG